MTQLPHLLGPTRPRPSDASVPARRVMIQSMARPFNLLAFDAPSTQAACAPARRSRVDRWPIRPTCLHAPSTQRGTGPCSAGERRGGYAAHPGPVPEDRAGGRMLARVVALPGG